MSDQEPTTEVPAQVMNEMAASAEQAAASLSDALIKKAEASPSSQLAQLTNKPDSPALTKPLPPALNQLLTELTKARDEVVRLENLVEQAKKRVAAPAVRVDKAGRPVKDED